MAMTYRGIVCDLDGTVYRHRDPIPGAIDAIETLRDRGVNLLFFSNDPRAAPRDYVDRLGEMGLAVAPASVRSSASVTADRLAADHPDESVYVVGSPGLRSVLEDRDVAVTTDYHDPDVVVASWTRAFDYETLMEAMWALEGDVPFYGTDPDVTVPIGANRAVPGTGAILAAIASVAGREPEILGKPSPAAAQAAIEAVDVPPTDCLVVGDRPDTDLKMGERAGMDTALVLTGVTDRADVADASVAPDLVVDSLSDLPARLD